MSAARSKPRQRAPRRRIPATFDKDLADQIRTLRRYAISLAGNPYDADDLVQETLRRAIQYGGNRQRVRDWQAYLFRVLHNVRNDELAQLARRPDTIPIDENGVHAIGSPPAQDAIIDYHTLDAALRAMPAPQRRVVLLTGLLGYSYREVAAILRVPTGTVMSRLARGRGHLRAKIGR